MNTEIPGVLFIVNSLCFGGAEKHVVSLLNNLDTTRFRLLLAYLKPEETLLPQIDVQRLQAVFCCDVGKKIDWRCVRRLAHEIESGRVDVLVCTNTYSMLYGFLARWLSHRPVKIIEVFHTTLLQTPKDKLQMMFYRPFFKSCDLLMYVCENQRSYWRKQGLRGKTDQVIHNGVDTEYFSENCSHEEKFLLRARYGFAANDYVVGICAALRPEKAHGDLLQAVRRLRDKGISAKCLIIGDGVERSSIEKQIAQLDLSGHVAITGFQKDVRPFVASTDVMVIVSHAIETFSIAALESMSLGKSMVMSKIGGAEEQIQEGWNGYVFPPGDINQLTGHLDTLADDQKRSSLSVNARQRVVDHFSLPVMVRRYEHALYSTLGLSHV